jgi:fatty acid desaturase
MNTPRDVSNECADAAAIADDGGGLLHAKAPCYSIPTRLNLFIATAQLLALSALLLIAGRVSFWPWMPVLALGYALLMNSAYLMLHEAEHAMLHPNRQVNDAAGTLLALFFPAPFHLLRQGHLGHHVRNRTDDEAFDFYFENDNRLWKHWAFYNILWGGFWLCIAASNLVLPLRPRLWSTKNPKFDRPTEALIESLNPRYDALIRLEAVAAIALHASFIVFLEVPLLHWALLIGAFGVTWSSMQLLHHYGTDRDVRRGAMNLRTFRWLDVLWLNHNWHQRHHEQPHVPWIHLPRLDAGPAAPRDSMLRAWLRQWRGPQPATTRVANPHAGRTIR